MTKKTKKTEPIATDPKVAILDKRLAAIEKALRKGSLKKKTKRALLEEFADLDGKRIKRLAKIAPAEPLPGDGVDFKKLGKEAKKAAKAEVDQLAQADGWKVEDVTPADLAHVDPERAKRYVAAKKYLDEHGHPGQPGPDDIDRSDAKLVDAYNFVVGTLTGHFITSDAEKAQRDAEAGESTAAIKERVKAKQAARAEADAAAAATGEPHANGAPEPTTVSKKKGKKADSPVEAEEARVILSEPGTPSEKVKAGKKARQAVEEAEDAMGDAPADKSPKALADPEAPQPRDRWDRPLIAPADGDGKPVGYRRVTTFIDVLDDKTSLVKWGRRIVVAGIAAIEQKAAGEEGFVTIGEVGVESVVDRVKVANRALAKAAKKADKALAKGDLTETQHADAHDVAEKAHRDALAILVDEAFQAGDGFVKAETGTRIHKLTELHDLGQPLPDDVTSSELRDLAAYEAAKKELNVEIQAVEQFVVIDEFQTAGTLDRRIRYDSPKLGRRITAIGDVKTGRVDFGAGKMTRQLALYAMGKGYDYRTNTRTAFRTNREVGLIFHIPAGSGRCEVFEIDLKKGLEGVKLCAAVYAHRTETTTAKVFNSIAKVDSK